MAAISLGWVSGSGDVLLLDAQLLLHHPQRQTAGLGDLGRRHHVGRQVVGGGHDSGSHIHSCHPLLQDVLQDLPRTRYRQLVDD